MVVNGAPAKSRPETRKFKYAEELNEKRSSENVCYLRVCTECRNVVLNWGSEK